MILFLAVNGITEAYAHAVMLDYCRLCTVHNIVIWRLNCCMASDGQMRPGQLLL